ncbi:MAG: hypothetical protein NUV49_00935 [Patescibacteria group bacterium]|nr:hypothetical protein [Patescibacteria group bacterium]
MEFLIDDEREEFTAVDLQTLSFELRTSIVTLRVALENYGLKLAVRGTTSLPRGFNANSHDRWYGPGACKSHGGSGHEQIAGFAGRRG